MSDLLDKASCLVVEECVVEGCLDTTGRVEAADVVVGGLNAVKDMSSQRSRRHDGVECSLLERTR